MSSYYSIDSILTDAQKIPCTSHLHLPNLGHLDNNPGSDIKPSQPLLLPLWLAEMLAVSQILSPSSSAPAPLSLSLPPPLAPAVINALIASPLSVDLRVLSPHFYALAVRMFELFEEEELVDVLVSTWKTRAAEIGDQAHNPRGVGGDGAGFLAGLEEGERMLFRKAHDGARAVRGWMAGEGAGKS